MSPSHGDKSLVTGGCPPATSCGISSRFQLLSPTTGQVAHVLLTRPPLSQILFRRISRESASFDLHVLGTPPAFVLSQDQTLNKSYLMALSDREINSSIAITSSQRNFMRISFQSPLRTLSGAYLHKLLLCSIYKVHMPARAKKQRSPRGALLIYHPNSGFVKGFFAFFSGNFWGSKYCVFPRKHYQYV